MSFDNIPEEKFKAMENAIKKSNQEKTYTVDQLWNILQLSRQNIYILIESWKIEAINVSISEKRKNYRISQKALDNFLNNQKTS